MKRKALVSSLIALSLGAKAYALDFVAQKIEFQGLQRINQDTAMSYLPVRPGSTINTTTSDKIIQDLFKTGFFSNVSLSRKGNVLIVNVQERPVIRKITLSGNKVIPSKELLKVLKQMDIAEGYEYNNSVLTSIRNALISQYYSHGKYNARVDVEATPEEKNGVDVAINISEGVTAVIKQINIIGNQVFPEKKLLDQFKLTTPGIFTIISHDDQYSSDKLAGDLETLKSYYLDRGYLKFQINSVQVSLTPDRKHVYIAIKVTEGPQYKFSGYDLTGKLILPKKVLEQNIQINSGEIFSRQQMINGQTSIADALGAIGYYRAHVDTQTKVNDDSKTVFVTFNVDPGRRVFVRHINFIGNSDTNDFAFRRALTQMEGGLISTTALDQSKQNLQQLPFVKDVDVSTQPVPGTTNQVDLNYKVSTYPAGEVKAGVGYSDVDGILLNTSLNEQNVFGTGNAFSANVSYSASLLSANISYFNPYYTPWGVGRGFSVYGSHYNAEALNISNYATDNYGFAINYSIPIASHDSFQFGFGLDYLMLRPSSDPSNIIAQFVNEHNKNFTQIPFNLGWTHNSLNRAVFPTRGVLQNLGLTISAPLSRQSLEYYKTNYSLDFYQPLYQSFIAKLSTDAGYGNGYGMFNQLPFFKNYYMGGMGSVRGYDANTIGPQDNEQNSIGGNLMFDSSVNIIFPNPFSRSLRTSVFVDAGNVYVTGKYANNKNFYAHRDNNGLRYSSGLEFDWLSPVGMLNFSLAKAINPSKYDSPELFQFNVGTSF